MKIKPYNYYYLPKNDAFDVCLRETVMAIPKELMAAEISRCELRLSMRVDGKCIISGQSEEWK